MNLELYNWNDKLFGDALVRFINLNKSSVQKTTYNGYIKYTTKIQQWFNDNNIFVYEIKADIIEEYYNYLRLNYELSENSIRHYHVIIYKFCKWLYQRDYIKDNPADKIINKPKVKKYLAKYYTEDEAKQLLLIVSQNYNSYFIAIVLAIVYGLRRSEICALRWCDINLDKKYLKVNNKLVKVSEGNKKVAILSNQLKSESCRRQLPLNQNMINILERIQLIRKPKKTDFVFTITNGEYVDPDTLSRTFKRIIENIIFLTFVFMTCGIRVHPF